MAPAFRLTTRPAVSENMTQFTVDFSTERAGLQRLHFLPGKSPKKQPCHVYTCPVSMTTEQTSSEEEPRTMLCSMFFLFGFSHSAQSSRDRRLQLRHPWQQHHGCLATSRRGGRRRTDWTLRPRVSKNEPWKLTKGLRRGMLGKNLWHHRHSDHYLRWEVRGHRSPESSLIIAYWSEKMFSRSEVRFPFCRRPSSSEKQNGSWRVLGARYHGNQRWSKWMTGWVSVNRGMSSDVNLLHSQPLTSASMRRRLTLSWRFRATRWPGSLRGSKVTTLDSEAKRLKAGEKMCQWWCH